MNAANPWRYAGREGDPMSSNGKDDRDPPGGMSEEQREAFRRRSSELGRKLDQAKPQSSGGGRSEHGAAMGRAWRVSAELIGGIVVGSAIGWYLDGWLGNKKPWFFVLFFLLGAAAGILNVIRSAMRERTPPLPSAKDVEDDDK